MAYKKKRQVPKEVSAYFSRIGKRGYKAKVKKLISRLNVGSGKAV